MKTPEQIPNSINMNDTNKLSEKRLKVAETYLKLDIEFSSESNKEIEKILRLAVEKNLVEFKYAEDIIYEISFDKGSTRARVAFFAFLNGLIFYADLKDSIVTIYNDAKWLSEQIIETAREESPLIDNNIIRTEKRTGIIGRLKRVLSRIEYLQGNLNNVGNNQIQQELASLYQEVANLIQLIDLEDRQTFLNAIPQNYRNNIPQANEYQVQHLSNLYENKN